MWLFRQIGRYGRSCLVLGLIAGLSLPTLSTALRPYLPQMIAALLFFTAFRIGLTSAVGNLAQARRVLGMVCLLQLALPLAALLVLTMMGLLSQPFALAVVFVLSAPAMTGAPNFTVMTGHDPAPTLRLLVVGTALFPLTALPVLWFLPLGGAALSTTAHLIIVIMLAVSAGFLARRLIAPDLDDAARLALDGMAALLLVFVAMALMSAIAPMLRDDPMRLLGWLAAVMAFNLVMQIGGYCAAKWVGLPEAVPFAICAGNRNAALFLIALPPEVTGPLLIFVGCYQIPMYLTPILLRRLFRHDRTPV